MPVISIRLQFLCSLAITLGFGFDFLDLHLLFPKAGLLESNGQAEEHGHAVTDLCTTLDGLLVAVAIQRQVSNYSIMPYFSSGKFTVGFLTSSI